MIVKVIRVEYDRVWDTHSMTVTYSDGSTMILSVDEDAVRGDEFTIEKTEGDTNE